MAVVMPLAWRIYPMPATVADAYGYTMTAQRLVADGVFAYGTEPPGTDMLPNAKVTPGWPLVLSGVYAITGLGDDPVADARVAHSAILALMYVAGLGIVLAATLSGRELGGDDLGLLAGVMTVAYLPVSWAGTVVLSAQFGTLFLMWQVYLALRFGAKNHPRKPWHMVLFGIVVALTLMFRPNLALWTLAPIVYLAARRFESPRRLAIVALCATLGFSMVFGPWWIRNAVTFGMFVPAKTDAMGKLASQVPPLEPSTDTTVVAGPASSYWEETDAGEALSRSLNPWVPFFDVLWEDTNNYHEDRVDYPEGNVASVEVGDASYFATLWYHRFIWLAAVVSLVWVKRSPRLSMLAFAPVAMLLVHGGELTVRYMYPPSVVLIIMAATTVYAGYRTLRRKAAIRSRG